MSISDMVRVAELERRINEMKPIEDANKRAGELEQRVKELEEQVAGLADQIARASQGSKSKRG